MHSLFLPWTVNDVTGKDPLKMNSLYQIRSKMLHSTKVIILVEKKRKEVAWLGFELTTSMLEGESANHYTMDPS